MECLVQNPTGQPVRASRPRPQIKDSHHVLVQIIAVALNPTDHKIPAFDTTPGAIIGCDFMGCVIEAGEAAQSDFPPGVRVCGAVQGSNPANPDQGAFAEYVLMESWLLLRVPSSWTDIEGAAVGGVGWGSVALTMESSLQLTGQPSKPADPQSDGTRIPVLVYGAATATGTMACQLLSLCGYQPIATATSLASSLVEDYRAAAVIPYTSPTCAAEIRNRCPGGTVRYALDCICRPDTVACCFDALSRVGARYAGLDHVPPEWRTRKAVKVDIPLTYGIRGEGVHIKEPYRREPDPAFVDLGRRWRDEMQILVDGGLIKPHPPRELQRGWDGVVHGLELLRAGKIRGQKLVVRL